jgi:hypothetical protein
MILESIIIGIVGWVFCLILIQPDMIFAKWQVVLDKLPEWLAKPLGGCEFCFTGQVALWYYLYQYHSTYGLIEHIAFICGSIFVVRLINKIIYGT